MPSPLITLDTLKQIAKLKPKPRRAAMKQIGKIEFQRCAEDIFYWLDASQHPLFGPYVYTQDPKPLHECSLCGGVCMFQKRALHLQLQHKETVEGEKDLRGFFRELSTTRAFTLHDYMRPIIDCWLREQFLLIPKSRDVMATWLVVTMYTWDTLFHGGRQNIFQSQTAPKTFELIQRSHFIWDHQPKFLKSVHPATVGLGGARSGVLTVPSLNSTILGFAQGPDQIRQYHPSGLYMDEAAFQDQAHAAFAAIKPAIQGGGRFTATSSANPSWFMLACLDKDMEGSA